MKMIIQIYQHFNKEGFRIGFRVIGENISKHSGIAFLGTSPRGSLFRFATETS